jgi:bifunctional non-homologous end joining protein LigD
VSLSTYRKKRDFKKTPEPPGRAKRSKSPASRKHGAHYVIQKHAATRLHYDFRLELDGTLKSWAVPKGPSCNPHDKRLAVHVEDHPLDYGSFEGTIPKGEYGGGTVMVWDRGTWESIDPKPLQSYKSGKMKFQLHGEKLKGAWALVRMKPRPGEHADNWLLIKERDEFAHFKGDITTKMPNSAATGRDLEEITAENNATWSSNRTRNAKKSTKAMAAKRKDIKNGRTSRVLDVAGVSGTGRSAMPKSVSPQLCSLVESVPTGKEWLHEVKFDGYRIVAFIEKGKATLASRNGKIWTAKFPKIKAACEDIPHSCVLDGEVVAMRSDGTTDFQALQNFLAEGKKPHLHYYVFDILHLDGIDLTGAPLRDRKAVLAQLLAQTSKDSLIHLSEHIEGNGDRVFANCCKLGLEGVVSKRADAPYIQKRSRTWLKVKCLRSQEFVLGGYTDPGGSRKGFGALLLGYFDNDGELVYAGRVGTGFSENSLRTIAKQLRLHNQSKSAYKNPPTGPEAKGVHWLNPKLVCEVEFTEWTNDGQLRHPSFKGMREDKAAKEIVREIPGRSVKNAIPRTGRINGKRVAPKLRRRPIAHKDDSKVAGVTISHPDKELFPEGITKMMLAEYYEQIADRMLPYIAGRPLSLLRCPDGRTGQCFFQKHMTAGLPDHVSTVLIREKSGKANYLVIEDRIGLIELANLGVLEFHVWGCRADEIERPDVVAFDLDPAPKVKPADIVEAANLLREYLRTLGLKSFLKTTGGKGYHVLAPLQGQTTWREVKSFAHAIALHMAKEEPSKYTANMTKSKRTGKIYIDYLRNTRGATFVAPYSTRARENAPVSMPLDWKELSAQTDPAGWTLMDLDWLRRKDPWKGFHSVKQKLPK